VQYIKTRTPRTYFDYGYAIFGKLDDDAKFTVVEKVAAALLYETDINLCQ
jgi:hypothetical protein